MLHPCLCGFSDPSMWRTRQHRKTCPVWQNRDAAAVSRERYAATSLRRGLKVYPRCETCGEPIGSPKHRTQFCDGYRRSYLVRKAGFHPSDWAKILLVLAKKYESGGWEKPPLSRAEAEGEVTAPIESPAASFPPSRAQDP